MGILVLHPKTEASRLIHLDKPSMMIGSAPDADIRLESDRVAECHARIEHKPSGYYLISLSAAPDLFINGVETTFHQLMHGDEIEIGGVSAEFVLTDAEAIDEIVPEEMRRPAPLVAETTALLAHPNRPMACPQCGLPLTPDARACPQCGQPTSTLPVIQGDFIPPVPTHQAGPGILPVIAFLAALTVVGAPVALVVGLITLSIIRRHGGTVRDQKMAKWSVGLGLLWLMLGVVAVGGAIRREHKREQLDNVEVYEAKVIRALKNLACAQKFAHTIEIYDADADGHGEYGDLSVLAGMKSPFFDTDLADGEAYGYKFTIREASEGRFLAVAEPIRYNETGGRTFSIDQLGQIRGGDAEGKRFGQIATMLPALQGERSAYYEIDNEIAKDVLNYAKALSSSPDDQEKKQRILLRLRKDYSLTTVGLELEGMERTVDRFVTEQRAETLYLEAHAALAEDNQDVALAKLMEITEDHPSFSKIAGVERELLDVRSAIAQRREKEAEELFAKAEEMERQSLPQEEVQQMFHRIETLYPKTDVAERITSLKPELQRQLRERNAEGLFSDLMELSPETEYDKILSQANQFRRNYNDTDLFEKSEAELTKQERKAHASSWRIKTQQNMAAGRTRGALAQLESAIKENPDLRYDLRDLSVQIYRDVADKLVEEGDARGALEYYTRLSRLLQASDSEEQVSQELLAKLHNDVGQADYERGKYEEARWHLASAAWQYQENALFNMRLGAASLYSGLYRPAETALSQALSIRPDMETARLYRAYLNMRVVLTFEQVIAERLNIEDPNEPEEEEEVGENPDEDGEGDEEEDEDEDENRIASSNTGKRDFSFVENERNEDSLVPEPTDLDLIIHYDYEISRQILPDILQFLVDLQETAIDFADELRDTPPRELASVKVGQVMQVSELRNELSGLRVAHLEDLAAQKELFGMMEEIKRRAYAAISDIQAASDKQQRIQSLAEHILQQINSKCTHLFAAAELLTGNMDKSIEMREKMFELAESALNRLSSSSKGARDMSRNIEYMIRKTDNLAEVDRALLTLRSSMEIDIDLKDILRAAEGHTSASQN